MKTVKLYDKDAFATEFESEILQKDKDTVILAETLFFPEEGGQTPDKGTIDGIKVTYVELDGEVIIHHLEKPLEKNAGDKVKGVIDFEHRFDNMQQHSAEHVFSGLVYGKYGYSNVGFHLSESECTMDFDGELTKEQIDDLELSVNRIIAQDRKIISGYPSAEELASLEYRSKKEIEGPVRIVEIEGVDKCACCAPHVRTTGQIGGFKIVSYMRHRGGMRLFLVAGMRLIKVFAEKMQLLDMLVNEFTTAEENIPGICTKMKEENKELKLKCASLNKQLSDYELRNIPENIPDVLLFREDVDMNNARLTVNELVEKHAGICAVFMGTDSTGYTFVLGSKSVDCRLIAGSLNAALAAKCGGSTEMITGKINRDADNIRAALLS